RGRGPGGVAAGARRRPRRHPPLPRLTPAPRVAPWVWASRALDVGESRSAPPRVAASVWASRGVGVGGSRLGGGGACAGCGRDAVPGPLWTTRDHPRPGGGRARDAGSVDVRVLAAALLDLVLPGDCAACGAPEPPWCARCRTELGPPVRPY